MRTCDICHTKIPFGSDVCPNCGYRMPKERSMIHAEHPQPTSKLSGPTLQQHFEQAMQYGRSKKKATPSLAKWIIGISLVAILVLGVAVPIITGLIIDDEHTSTMQETSEVYDSMDDLVAAYPEMSMQVSKLESTINDYNRDLHLINLNYETYEAEDDKWSYFYVNMTTDYDRSPTVNLTISQYKDLPTNYSVMIMYDKEVTDFESVDYSAFEYFLSSDIPYASLFQDIYNQDVDEYDYFSSRQYNDIEFSLMCDAGEPTHLYASFDVVGDYLEY